jgi:hypothetical protein
MRTNIQWTSILASLFTGTSSLLAGQGEVNVLNSLPSGSDSIVVGHTYLVPIPMELRTANAKSSFALQLHDVTTGLSTIVSDEIVEDGFLRWVVNPSGNGLKRLLIVDLQSGGVVEVSSSYLQVIGRTTESVHVASLNTREFTGQSSLRVSSIEQVLEVVKSQSEQNGAVTQLEVFTYDGRCLGRLEGSNASCIELARDLLNSVKDERFLFVLAKWQANTLLVALTH